MDRETFLHEPMVIHGQVFLLEDCWQTVASTRNVALLSHSESETGTGLCRLYLYYPDVDLLVEAPKCDDASKDELLQYSAFHRFVDIAVDCLVAYASGEAASFANDFKAMVQENVRGVFAQGVFKYGVAGIRRCLCHFSYQNTWEKNVHGKYSDSPLKLNGKATIACMGLIETNDLDDRHLGYRSVDRWTALLYPIKHDGSLDTSSPEIVEIRKEHEIAEWSGAFNPHYVSIKPLTPKEVMSLPHKVRLSLSLNKCLCEFLGSQIRVSKG